MKTLKQLPKLVSKSFFFFLLLLTAVIFTTCVQEDYYYKIYYFDVYGEGYVYYSDTNLPIEGAKIELQTILPGDIFGYDTTETFYTDSKGYYRLRFMRYVYGEYPSCYYCSFYLPIMPKLPDSLRWSCTGGPDFFIPIKMIINAKQTIKFDTIKVFAEKK